MEFKSEMDRLRRINDELLKLIEAQDTIISEQQDMIDTYGAIAIKTNGEPRGSTIGAHGIGR